MEDDVGYSTVTQKAMLIGVNNMKRRRVRTMLTTATIVLIAFTMLAVHQHFQENQLDGRAPRQNGAI